MDKKNPECFISFPDPDPPDLRVPDPDPTVLRVPDPVPTVLRVPDPDPTPIILTVINFFEKPI